MYKPESLRAHLLASVQDLAGNADRLLVFIDAGRMRCTAAPGLSFEYEYTLNLIITDFGGDPDAVAVPLFAWLRVHQPELLLNLDKSREGVTFEADIIDNTTVDLSIKLPLSERVIVKPQEAGALEITHPVEPPMIEPGIDAEHWRLYLKGELIAEWDSP